MRLRSSTCWALHAAQKCAVECDPDSVGWDWFDFEGGDPYWCRETCERYYVACLAEAPADQPYAAEQPYSRYANMGEYCDERSRATLALALALTQTLTPALIPALAPTLTLTLTLTLTRSRDTRCLHVPPSPPPSPPSLPSPPQPPSETDCSLPTQYDLAVCQPPSQPPYTEELLFWGLGYWVIVFAVMLLVLCCCCCFAWFRMRRDERYEESLRRMG